jgi:hypothetical protein
MELSMVRGWAYYSYAMATDGWLVGFAGIKQSGDGYIAGEIKSLMKQVKNGR